MISKRILLLHSTKVRILLILILAFFLRIWKISSVPPSPYWEEVAIGFDAYSILKTGKDHHGHFLPIVAFESFGDYKPTLYFYAVTVAELFFGLNVFSVRLPSVLAGVMSVLLIGVVVAQLLRLSSDKDEKIVKHWSEIAMLLAAISPWLIQFSRGGWEVNLATCLVLTGIFFGLQNWSAPFQITKKYLLSNFIFTAIFLIASMYTYHATRLIAPLIGLLLIFPLLKKPLQNLKSLSILTTLSIILLFPLLLSLSSKEVSQRFAETSAIPNFELVKQSNALISADGNTRSAKIIHHRWILYAQLIGKNILSHLNSNYLFLSGDQNPRHSIQYFGQLYHVEIIFVFIGLIGMWKREKKLALFLLSWLLIVLFPASLTMVVPHALRTLSAAPVFIIIAAYGVGQIFAFFQTQKYQKILFLLIGVIYFVELSIYLNFYYKIYPQKYASEWQWGYDDLMQVIESKKHDNLPIYISRAYGRPAMYFWFYNQTDPRLVQAEAQMHEENGKNLFEDQGEFLQYQNIRFLTTFTGSERGLIAIPLQDMSKFPSAKKIAEIKDPVGETRWVVIQN